MNLSNITVNQQSSIRIQGEKVIYFDPFGIVEEKKDADIIFVTHEHFDHFEPESIQKIKKDGTILVVPVTMREKASKEAGISEEQIVAVSPSSSIEVSGLQVDIIPSYNVLKPFHTKGSKWVGYKVTMDGVSYYVAGDTDVNKDVKEVKCDVALLPIGGHYTMDKKHAAELTGTICPKAAIPTHYGSIVGKTTDGEDYKKLVNQFNPEIIVELKL